MPLHGYNWSSIKGTIKEEKKFAIKIKELALKNLSTKRSVIFSKKSICLKKMMMKLLIIFLATFVLVDSISDVYQRKY